MFGRFLQPDAAALIRAATASDGAKAAACEVVEKGYTVIPGAVGPQQAADLIAAFRRFEATNDAIFGRYRDSAGHYPRILNLHTALLGMADLFARNQPLLETLDLLFGKPATLYTSLFYETGSQQALHRDSPVFATRPEYMYFGTTVYLEPTDDQNGCLEVLEGGHRLAEPDRERMALRRYGSLQNLPAFDNDFWVEYQNRVANDGLSQGLGLRKLHVQTGDTLIWHPQTPHGGSRIEDRSRTRFSMVMHVIPVDTPVYHQNAFFNPRADLPTELRYQYQETGGRPIIDQRPNGIGFALDDPLPLAAFNGLG
jgi:ectoine hydroxylase-related dioxygenase (phytanoyl-CoA dioxygenase family)